MKLTTPFTILNRKFNERDFIRHALKSKENFATERFYNDYLIMFKSDPCIYIETKNLQIQAMNMLSLFERFQLLEVNHFI